MLDAVRIPPNELFALLTAISFAAGLNVYATIATLGLLAHTGNKARNRPADSSTVAETVAGTTLDAS